MMLQSDQKRLTRHVSQQFFNVGLANFSLDFRSTMTTIYLLPFGVFCKHQASNCMHEIELEWGAFSEYQQVMPECFSSAVSGSVAIIRYRCIRVIFLTVPR